MPPNITINCQKKKFFNNVYLTAGQNLCYLNSVHLDLFLLDSILVHIQTNDGLNGFRIVILQSMLITVIVLKEFLQHRTDYPCIWLVCLCPSVIIQFDVSLIIYHISSQLCGRAMPSFVSCIFHFSCLVTSPLLSFSC